MQSLISVLPVITALVVIDLEKFAKLAHNHGVPFIVDNTFAMQINCRPFEWGADIVTHSTTKYIDGHAMSVGGCIVDSGNFDWTANADKFPGLTTPDDSYHGVAYTDKFGKAAFIMKATAQIMRDLGSSQAPQNAFSLLPHRNFLLLYGTAKKHLLRFDLDRHPKIQTMIVPVVTG